MKKYSIAAVSASFALLCLTTSSTRGAELIVDGGFEPPNPTTVPNQTIPGGMGGSVYETTGSMFGGPTNDAWTVVQIGSPAQEVAVVSTTQNYNPGPKYYYNANSGLQWLDLTGYHDNGAMVGVQQTVATISSTLYQLTFFVGHWGLDPGPAVTQLNINGVSVGTFTNSIPSAYPPYNGDGVAGNTWEQFTYDFTATSASTTIAFYNLSASGVSANGLDDVSLGAVPEPATWAAGAGVALLLAFHCLKNKRQA